MAMRRKSYNSLAKGLMVATLAVVVACTAVRGDAPALAVPVRQVPPGLLPIDAPEGRRLLLGSEANASFFALVSHFKTQRSLTYCGVATLAMVLNALGVPAPESADHKPYRMFTQDNLFSDHTDGIVKESRVMKSGMSLTQVADVLRAYGVTVQPISAGHSSLDRFRTQAVHYLKTEGHHVIVNYSRGVLGQEGEGHISPLAAYDAETDMFLLMDVARYKSPAVWIGAGQLFAAMAAPVGDDAARTRGYVLVGADTPAFPTTQAN